MHVWRHALSFLAICSLLTACGSGEKPPLAASDVPLVPPGPVEPKKDKKVEKDSEPKKTPENPTKWWKHYEIGQSQVKVKMPPEWRQSEEPNDTLVFSLPGEPFVKFRLNDQGYFNVNSINGEAFVRTQAKLKNLPLIERNGKLIVTETTSGNGTKKTSIATYWFVGFGDRVVVMSLTMFEEQKDEAEFKEFLDKAVPLIIESLQK